MMKVRRKAVVINTLKSISCQQHDDLKKLGSTGQVDWSTSDGEHKDTIAFFRNEIKEHYFHAQNRRCCYCSIELHDHKLTYDAEHILDKADYLEYMFETGNLAAACKLCNGSKSNKPISRNGQRFNHLSRETTDYSIVHPHLDEWTDHLSFDSIGRIVAKMGSTKGSETIRICGMAALNAARLADEFAMGDQKEAEFALRTFHEVEDLARKQEIVDLLELMAHRCGHAGASAVVGALRSEMM